MVAAVITPPDKPKNFQYSLCRVVLMVLAELRRMTGEGIFQYSLCRVVLMV